MSQQSIAGQRILILREGSTRTTGKDVQTANIQAATIVADVVKATLGPRGMDKMLVSSLGDATISNDGHEILKEIDVQHPAAKMIVEVSKAQDDEVGDGTTTAVILAGELLKSAGELLDKGIHPTIIVSGYRKAEQEALRILRELAVPVDTSDRKTMKKIAMTSMRGKVIGGSRDYFSDIAIDAVMQVAEKKGNGFAADIDDIQIVKKTGKSLMDTHLIQGIIIDKEAVHPDMPKTVKDARIALLDFALEIEKTQMDAEIRIHNPLQMKSFLDEESSMLQEMVGRLAKTGANVVLCQTGIDDVAQHFLAKAGILAVRRIKASDMQKLEKATGARIVTTLTDLTASELGTAKMVEERKIGEDKMVFIEGCKNPKAVSIIIRASSERLLDEIERSLHDALFVIKDIVKDNNIVAGGGSIEEEVSQKLRTYATKIGGREQLAIERFANSLEVIPTTLAENAGLNIIDMLVEIRSAHEKTKGRWMGVNAYTGKVTDMMKEGVIEPLSVKVQAIKSAVEAASMILRIDDVIASAKAPPMPQGGGMPQY
jgi:thermosome